MADYMAHVDPPPSLSDEGRCTRSDCALRGCLNPANCLGIPDSFTLVDGEPEALLESPSLVREAREERRLLKQLLRLSRESRQRIWGAGSE